MSIFEDVTLRWKGEDYTVPADKVMRMIAKIEDEVTLAELARKNPPIAKIAIGFAAALQYAGVKNVTGDDVYQEIFSKNYAQAASDAVTALLMIMMPPESYRPPADPKPKPKAQQKKRVRSKAPTGQQ